MTWCTVVASTCTDLYIGVISVLRSLLSLWLIRVNIIFYGRMRNLVTAGFHVMEHKPSYLFQLRGVSYVVFR